MGGGGAIQAMIDSLKANKRQKKDFGKHSKKEKIANKLKNTINDNGLSEQELQEVKSKIKQKMAKENRRKRIIRLSIFACLTIGVLILIYKFYINVEETQAYASEKYEQSQNEELQRRQQYVLDGFKLLDYGNYKYAKIKFLRAAKIDPDDYLLQLGLTTAYVRLCMYQNTDCQEATNSLENLKKQYGLSKETVELSNEFSKVYMGAGSKVSK